jgi:ethanolamine utilization cobalamin adenosyltransferase
LKEESPNKDIINIERSVLNSRFIVEQEIDPSQKLHIRKDKIIFSSAKDVLEDRSTKEKILQ